MRQVFLDKNLITVNHVCKPLLKDNSLLVSVHYSFISRETETLLNPELPLSFNSFIKNLAKTLDSLVYSHNINQKSLLSKSMIQALGYSCAGQIISTGKNIKNFRPGDYVACMGIGIAHHADFVCVPEDHAVKVEAPEMLAQASAIALGTKAVEIFLQSKSTLGDTVCVVGLDCLGLLIMQIAAATGCNIIGMDYNDTRLATAHAMGSFTLLKLSDTTLVENIEHYTNGTGISSIFITQSLDVADEKKMCALIADKGKIIITDNTRFKFTECCFDNKEINLILSKKFLYPAIHEHQLVCMKKFIQLLENKKISIESLIDQHVIVERVNQAYEKIKDPHTKGIVLSYIPKPPEINETNTLQYAHAYSSLLNNDESNSQDIGLALIGIDSYTRNQLIPLITKMNNIKLHALIDHDITQTLEIAKKHKQIQILNNEEELFAHTQCQALILNSTEAYEPEKIINLLNAGKAVFIQNFITHSTEQLKKLKTFLNHNPWAKLGLNYKRSFSPFIQKIKSVTQKRTTPLMIHYRLNDVMDRHDELSGHDAGKIINQAGHIIDIFCFLTEAQPLSISVESLNPSHDKIFPTDNFCAHISFNDGSVCSLMFTNIGHHGCGQERMELFFDSKTIVMNDFISLIGYGLPKSFNEKVFVPDYGQEAILKHFFKTIAQSQDPVIPFERLCTVAHIALTIDQLACQGGGTH